MAHGTPDWGMAVKTDIFSLVDDLAELPPRMGFPSSIDRRGSVLLMETFDTGLGLCFIDEETASDSGGLSADYARFGRFTCKLSKDGNVGAAVGVRASIACVATDKIGLEAHFFSTNGLPNVDLNLGWRDGTNIYYWGLRWDTTNSKVYIGTNSVGWESVTGTFPYSVELGLTHIMKVVINSDDYSYVRAFIDGTALTLPDIDLITAADARSPHLRCSVYNGPGNADDSIIYVDAIILTRGEQ